MQASRALPSSTEPASRRSPYEQWYYIQTTKTKKRAWVLARYIDLAEDVDEDSIVVYEE